MTKTLKLLTAAFCSAGVVSFANAASLTPNFLPGEPVEILNQDEANPLVAQISVFDGKAGWQGIGGNPDTNLGSFGTDPRPSFGFFGDGTVVDYRFFGNGNAGSANDADPSSLEAETRVAGPAGRIGSFSATTAFNTSGGGINFLDIYETTDPGAGFGTGMIVPAGPADYATNTMARIADGTGTIDITNMTDGDIYFLAGGAGSEIFTLTMSGAGQDDIEVQAGGSWPRDNRVHLHDWSFDNADLLYDTITYHFRHGDRDGSYSRFGGVVLDGTVVTPNAIPSPTAALAGLIGLGGLVSRRRRKDA